MNVDTFVKHTNLMEYFDANPMKCCDNLGVCYADDTGVARVRKYYARERKVYLQVLSRHEGGKCICEIKCPINPLPVVGEFTVPSFRALVRFLEKCGWEHTNTIPASILKSI